MEYYSWRNFENMLRLMRFGVYFKKFLKIKWLFSYRNNYSIVTRIYALTPLRFFALTHLILELHYCALVTFPKK